MVHFGDPPHPVQKRGDFFRLISVLYDSNVRPGAQTPKRGPGVGSFGSSAAISLSVTPDAVRVRGVGRHGAGEARG